LSGSLNGQRYTRRSKQQVVRLLSHLKLPLKMNAYIIALLMCRAKGRTMVTLGLTQ